MEYTNNNSDGSNSYTNRKYTSRFLKDVLKGELSFTDSLVSNAINEMNSSVSIDFVNNVIEYGLLNEDDDSNDLEYFFEELVSEKGEVIVFNWLNKMIKKESTNKEFLRGLSFLFLQVSTKSIKNIGGDIAFMLMYYNDYKVQENSINVLERLKKVQDLRYLGSFRLTDPWLEERVNRLIKEYE